MSDSSAVRPVHGATAASPRNDLRRLRRWWLQLHRWVGLLLGVLFVVTGTSGSVITFRDELDALLAPEFHRVEPAPDRLALQALYDSARRQVPQMAQAMLTFDSPAAPVRIVYRDPQRDQRARFELAIDPSSGELVGQRQRSGAISFSRTEILGTILNLHANLWMGRDGRTLLGALAWVLLFSALSGIYLWWPRNGNWRQALMIRSDAGRARLHFDLHRVTGIVTAAILILIAFTGSYFAFHDAYRAVIGRFSPVTMFDRPPKSVAEAGRPMLPIDSVVAIAARRYPQAVPTSVMMPESPGNPYTVVLRRPDDGHGAARLRVSIDPWRGVITHVRDPQQGTAGDAIVSWMLPLHSGEAFGLTGRVLVLLTGISLLGLFVTGLTLWLCKRRVRPAAKRRERGVLSADLATHSIQSQCRPCIEGESPS